MRISELIEELSLIKKDHGDIEVVETFEVNVVNCWSDSEKEVLYQVQIVPDSEH